MPHQPLSSKDDVDSAISSNPGKYVLIYIYSGEMDDAAKIMGDNFSATTVPYKIETSDYSEVEKDFKVTTVPTILVFKDGTEVKRVENPSPDNMGPVVKMLSA